MKLSRLGLTAAAALATAAGSASATPLRLDYCVSDLGGGQFQYTFVLSLDNHDNSWAPGQGWRWFIFGDANGTTSPLDPFIGDNSWLPVGPWTGYSSSGGGHNGPTFSSVLDYWVPNAVGEQLVWQGTSPQNLPDGQMLFSTLAGTLNNGIAADFEVAHRLTGGCLGPTGACCRTDGSCIVTTNASCTAQGGIYRGDGAACATANCPQPPTGACCHEDGTCSVLTAAQCAAFPGVYHGNNVTCAAANCPQPLQFTMNCNIPGHWTEISGTGTPLVFTGPDDGDASIVSGVTNVLVNNPNLTVCTNGFVSNVSTLADYFNQPLPYSSPGLTFGLFPNWDDLFVDGPGQVYHQTLLEGTVTVDVIEWSQVRTYFNGPGGAAGSFEIKIFGAGGPALVQYLYQGMAWDWNGNSSTVGVQWGSTLAYLASYGNNDSPASPPFPIADGQICSIVQVGVSNCYANCDHSTTVPCLNVLDFSCFLNAFAAQDTYANCDLSTQPPVLNVLDFSCFLNKFAAGCSSC